MECNEVQTLCGPYLDSELDARTTLEIEQHLKSCPECARFFTEEERQEAQIKAGLKRGQRTAALWEQIEQSVAAAASATARSTCVSGGPPPAARRGPLAALREQLQAGWRRSRWAWSGLAVAWAVILGLNFTAREPGATSLAAQRVPSASEVRLAWKQKQLLMADLAGATEPAPADKAPPPSPRGEQARRALNT